MSSFFLFNNLLFAAEIFGALAFLVTAWLAFDAFLIHREFKTATRWIGFGFLAVWQILLALNLNTDYGGYLAYLFYFLGLAFVIANAIWEWPVKVPRSFRAVFMLPVIGLVLPKLNAVATFGLAIITLLSIRQYAYENKKSLLFYWLGFFLLTAGSAVLVLYEAGTLAPLRLAGAALRLAGFASLGLWAWQYLQFRIKEEIILILISFALFISIVVTFAFSTILLGQVEAVARGDLSTSARVVDFSIERLKRESLAKAALFASDSGLHTALAQNDFARLDELATQFLEKEDLGFLTLIDSDGTVVLRAHSLAQREDSAAGEAAAAAALGGQRLVVVETSTGEGFSVRAAAPVISKGKTLGAVIAGFPLDNAFVDNIKRVTGLDLEIFEEDIRIATTLFNPDRRTRATGIKLTEPGVVDAVLGEGKAVTLRLEILSRPFLASYLPLLGADQRIVGMISSAKPQQELLATVNAANRLTLFAVVIIMVILIIPVYLLTKRLAGEVR